MSKQRAITAWRKLLGAKQDQPIIRYALTGDGSDAATADVEGRPGWAWVRYDEKPDHVSQVMNLVFPGVAQNLPVIVGKRYPTDRFYQILGINWELYFQTANPDSVDNYILPIHGETHTAGTGSDPAPIATRNIVNGLVHETSPVSMSVYAESLIYEVGGSLVKWTGGSIDLTSSVPSTSGKHRYTLISIDASENVLRATDGDLFPSPIAPGLPDVPQGDVPLAIVELRYGDTSVEADRIYDYRVMFSTIGGDMQVTNRLLALVEAELDFDISKHVTVGGDMQDVRLWGYDGSEWRKLQLLFGFGGLVEEDLLDDDLDAGTNWVYGTLVPAGEIWVIQNAMVLYSGSSATRVGIVGVGLADSLTLLAKESPDSDWPYPWSGNCILQQGDRMGGNVFGATAGDKLYFRYAGYKMEIE